MVFIHFVFLDSQIWTKLKSLEYIQLHFEPMYIINYMLDFISNDLDFLFKTPQKTLILIHYNNRLHVIN